MLPKISTTKRDNVASTLIVEDHLKFMLAKAGNIDYKPWKNSYAPKNPHSPFGDFPKDYKLFKQKPEKIIPIYENSQAATTNNKYISKGLGTGGRCATSLPKKPEHIPLKPVANAKCKRKIALNQFRYFYDRGDLPIKVDHQGSVNKIVWKTKCKDLDYHHYLPIFFDGLRDRKDPYRFLSIMGTTELLEEGKGKILPVIPQLIVPIKTNLNTRDPEIIAINLKILQKLVNADDMIGEALVPYFRQLLPICNIFINSNLNIGDYIDYGQRKKIVLGDLICETLELFEINGGEDAFINIKYLIPTYESCILN